MKKQRLRRQLLLATMAAGTLYLPVTAEGAVTSTSQVTVTNPNQNITNDISITNGPTPAAVLIPRSASGGVININSQNIEVKGTRNYGGTYGIISFNEGYEGNVNLTSGMNITGTFSGTQVGATGMSFFDTTQLSVRNTGRPSDGTVSLGDNITIQLKNQNENNDENHPVIENRLGGLIMSGETIQAGNSLTIGVTAHTGSDADMSAVSIAHYGAMTIGDSAHLSVENYTSGPMTHNLTDVIQSSLQHSGERPVQPVGRNYLKIGKDAEIKGTYTSDEGLTDNQLIGQEFLGLRLHNTEVSVDDSAHIILNGSGSARIVGGAGIRDNSDVSFKDNAVNQLNMDGYAQTMYNGPMNSDQN